MFSFISDPIYRALMRWERHIGASPVTAIWINIIIGRFVIIFFLATASTYYGHVQDRRRTQASAWDASAFQICHRQA
jgi:hypothetical protein